MATTLLKRLLKSVSLNRSMNPNSSSSSSENKDFIQSSTGSFDMIPSDVFMIILKFLEPRDAARASTVCKSWNLLVSDNQLWVYFLQNQQESSWESIRFAETHLRNGKNPLQTYYNQPMPLSYMRIYGQRTQVMGSVVIDGGSGYCKFGWSKYPHPSGCSATFMEFGNIESPMYSRLQFYFATIYSRMQVKPSTQPIVLSIPICHCDDTDSSKAARRQLKQTIYKVLFDMNVPAVCSVNQAVLALYAARRTSGIVVNIGFRVTSIVPILRGKVMHQIGIEVVGQGALKLTGFLKELMHQKNINVESLYTIRTLKENLCYVATDYETELSKDTQATYEVLGDGHFTLSKERFQTGEILFQPRMGGLRTMGLHQAVALCMDHCQAADIADDDKWFKTVVLAGGTACLPGLPERLHKELCRLLPPSISNDIRVIPPSYGTETAWIGAKLISNLSTFRETWCMTKKQYRKKMKGYPSGYDEVVQFT